MTAAEKTAPFSDMFNEWKGTKSYATKENLIKDLEKKGLMELRPLYVLTPEGRHTAIFSWATAEARKINPPTVAWLGYKIMN